MTTTNFNVADEIIITGTNIWKCWAAMWNGNLNLANDIIGDGYYIHLTHIKYGNAETLHNAITVMEWVNKIRNYYIDLEYFTSAGPFIDTVQQVITCHWKAKGTQAGRSELPEDIAGNKIYFAGTDILKFRSGKIYECWTMNNPVSHRNFV